MSEPSIPPPQYTLWDCVNVSVALAKRALEEVRALAGSPDLLGKEGPQGKAGPRGEPGADGKQGPEGREGKRGEAGPVGAIAGVEEWTDRVQYEGVVRTFAGATFQAVRDTAKPPPHADWHCLAAAGHNGKDGRSLQVRQTYDPSKTDYQELQIVALNGGSFVARRDNPGPCPGEGWQLIASQGKRGDKGERGERGIKGDKGDPGLPVVKMAVDGEGLLTLTNADGSTVQCDLYPLLAKVQNSQRSP